MSAGSEDARQGETVTVRYWASARSAAGVAEEQIPLAEAAGPGAPASISLAALRDAVLGRHPDAVRLPDVLKICSVLVDERPVGTQEPEQVRIEAGQSVEFLPPFAGG